MADKNHTFLGNKNKTESFDVDAMDANLLQVSPINGNENHGDVIEIMDTVNLDQALFQNCSLNSLNDLGHVQNLSCDTVDTKGIQTEFVRHGLYRGLSSQFMVDLNRIYYCCSGS